MTELKYRDPITGNKVEQEERLKILGADLIKNS